MDDSLVLKNRLKEYRKELDLSQDELAEKVFVTRQDVSRWENGETVPGRELGAKEAEYWIDHFESTIRRLVFTPFFADDQTPD